MDNFVASFDMSTYQRRKGAVGEREAAQELCDSVGLIVTRQARNGIDGGADVAGDGIIVEVKRRDGGLIVETWLQQAERSRVRPIDVPIVMARADNCAWIVSLRLADLGDFVQVIEQHRKQRA